MLKQKKYDWKDSNMALFGSDTERKVKKESAESEPAWQGAGQEPGLKIWRVVKFEIKDWDDDYGNFYDGDSYIILNTYKEEDGDELKYDVHFWIGKFSTQDEYGTAAYKTVELDTFLDDKPVQHREVMEHESSLFLSYFDSIKYMKGGADTGFRRVLPEQYVPRLFHIAKKERRMTSTEVAFKRSNLTPNDVFVLDMGLRIIQWNGSECSHDEKYKAAQEVQRIMDSRGGKEHHETLEENDTPEDHEFYSLFPDNVDDDDEKDEENSFDTVLYRLSDADGSMDMEEIARGDINQGMLSSDDVFLIESMGGMFCYIGGNASVDERRNGMSYACNHLNKTEHPWLPVSVVSENQGSQNKEFCAVVPA